MSGSSSNLKDWKEYKLEDLLVDIQPGFARRPSEDGDVVHLRTNNISPDGRLDLAEIKHIKAAKNEIERYALAKGDVLFNNTNSDVWVGKTAFVREDVEALYSNHLTRLRTDGSKLNPEFLAIYLHKLQRDGLFKRISTRWVNQTAVNTGSLRRLTLRVPSLEGQAVVVGVFRRIDSLILKRQKANQLTNRITQSVFLKMFGDPETNSMEWEVKTIGDVASETQYGLSKALTDDARQVPIVRMKNITMDGRLDLSEMMYVDIDARESAKYQLRRGDILFNRTNSRELVGKTGLVTTQEGCVFASYLIRVKTRRDRCAPEYLWAYLNSAHGKKVLLTIARGAVGQANINSQELKSIRILVPPLALQARLVAILPALESLKIKQDESAHSTIELFKSLMYKAFRGELANRDDSSKTSSKPDAASNGLKTLDDYPGG